jgi:hypothetical protein
MTSQRPDELDIRAWSPLEPDGAEAFEPLAGEPDPLRLHDETHLDWALRRNPAGARVVLARRGGRVVARCVALAVRTRLDAETRLFAQLLELGARADEDPEVRLATARSLLEPGGDPGAGAGVLVHYGWPEERDQGAWKGALGFELLRASALLLREAGPGSRALPPGVEEPARLGSEVDVLYSACASHWRASAVRDAAFLNWRFVENPRHRYRLLAVRGGEVLRGLAVYRSGTDLGARLGLLLDWLVLPGDEEASERLLAAASACARADGAGVLAASFPEWSPWALYFQERGFSHHPSEHLQLVHSALARLDMLFLRDHWWTTLADTLLL